MIKIFIGAHISISKGLGKAIDQAIEIGANTLQIFSRNPRGTKAKALDLKDIESAKQKMMQHKFGHAVAHAPYILNLGSTKEDLRELAVRILAEDLARIEQMGVKYLIIHPGSHGGAGIETGIARIAAGLNEIFALNSTNTVILLETMAGSGSEVGGNFREIADIIDKVNEKSRVGVCLDTCHLYGGGYDLVNKLDQVLEAFDDLIGVDKIKAVHLNDSLMPLNSKKDRHANLGEGLIGLEALAEIMKKEYFAQLPFVLETPGGLDIYKRDIEKLRNMLEGKQKK